MTGLVRKLLFDYLIENNCERNTKVVAVAINSLLMKQQDYNFMIPGLQFHDFARSSVLPQSL